MGSFGETLRQARLDMGVSLSEAEHHTLIRRKYLEALENEDAASLPAPVYTRGFIRTYAEYLGLNPEAMIGLYQATIRTGRDDRPVIRPATPEMLRSDGGLPWKLGLLAVTIAGALLLIGYLWGQYNSFVESLDRASSPTGSRTPQPTSVLGVVDQPRQSTPLAALLPTPTMVPRPTATPAPSPTPIQGIVLEARLVGRSWLEVWVDGKSVLRQTLEAGETRTFSAKESIRMRVGNAGGVQVTVNGVPQGPLGASGQVVEASWGR